MTPPLVRQYSTHVSMFTDRVVTKFYLENSPGLDHTCVETDTDGTVLHATAFVTALRMYVTFGRPS